jgi:hypothetical protein
MSDLKTYKITADLARIESELEVDEVIEKLREFLETAKIVPEPETDGLRIEVFRQGNRGAEQHISAVSDALDNAGLTMEGLQITVMAA